MDSLVTDKIKHVSNTEVIRRLLIKYFLDKNPSPGSFDRHLYPPSIQDLASVIPVLANKIEIVPYAADLDPIVGKLTLGWNLYVLGHYRMFLGETTHSNLSDFARQVRSGYIQVPDEASKAARKQTTPRSVITFITRVLGGHDGGYVDLSPPSRPIKAPGEPYFTHAAMLSIPQQFYNRPYSG